MQLNNPNCPPGLLALLGLSLLATAHPTGQAMSLDEPSAQIKWLDYQERQDGADRMAVKAWAARASLNFNESWGVQAYSVVDAISGASPVYYASPLAFAKVTDKRKASDLRLLHVRGLYRMALGASTSRENDYNSDGKTLQFSRASDDQNTTWDFGWSETRDRVSPVNKVVSSASKRGSEQLVGIRWNASPADALQLQWTRSDFRGYLSDPYKFLDQRPTQRTQSSVMFRWNRHMPASDSTLRWSARGVHDTWAAHSFMTQAEWAMPLTSAWRMTPSVRYYTQQQARFFSAPQASQPLTPNIPSDFVFGRSDLSFDQRLSAFGALTLGLQLDWTVTPKNQLNLRVDAYRQRGAWSAFHSGTRGMADFNAHFVQVGWTHFWDR
jgi:hypothetical protein